jgi:hypothetical protein
VNVIVGGHLEAHLEKRLFLRLNLKRLKMD